MTDLADALLLVLRAHAPAATSVGLALAFDMELRNDLGFDLIALAELAVAIEDAFGVGLEISDLDGCRTVRDLEDLVVAKSA